MDRLRRAISLTQNSSSKDSKKNKETTISNKIEKSLHDWKLPLSSASDVFDQIGRMYFSPDSTAKTVEKEIPLSEGYAAFPLFTENLQRVHQKNDHNLHVGMIQVGLKPTKLGSNISAMICLRDKRLRNFHESILGMVESSLCDGPIYFSYFPTHHVSLADPYLSSAFTIDVKTQFQASTDENTILAYRFHYKLLNKFDPNPNRLPRGLVRDVKGETTLFLQNLARGNCVVSKKVYWDQVSVPEGWMVRTNPSASSTGESNARVDWEETAEAHVLRVDVPGFKREEVKIEVEDGGIVQISGERSNEHEDKSHVHKWHCQERSGGGKFLRRFKLPENADLEKMKAAMKNGVLTVTVPKEESQGEDSLALMEF